MVDAGQPRKEQTMPQLGVGELVIILLIVVVLFGGGRVSKLGGELGTAIREFRRGVGAGENEAAKKTEELPVEAPVETPKQS
jgi:sec-independent protein translocase protein TatA